MVVPAGEGLVAASPRQPVGGMAGWWGRCSRAASRRAISGTVSAIMPGSAGGGRPGRTGSGAGAPVPGLSRAAVIAQMAAGHDQHGVPGDRGVEPDLGLVQPEAVLPASEFSFTGHFSPAARISRVNVSGCPAGT